MKIFGNADKIEEYGTPHADATDVEGVVVVAYDPAINKWLALRWTGHNTIWLVGGGNEADETFAEAAVRELSEETGYTEFTEQVQLGGPIMSHYYNDKKAKYRRSKSRAFLFILDSTNRGEPALEEHEKFGVVWMEYEPLRAALLKTGGGVEHWLAVLSKAHRYVQQR